MRDCKSTEEFSAHVEHFHSRVAPPWDEGRLLTPVWIRLSPSSLLTPMLNNKMGLNNETGPLVGGSMHPAAEREG